MPRSDCARAGFWHPASASTTWHHADAWPTVGSPAVLLGDLALEQVQLGMARRQGRESIAGDARAQDAQATSSVLREHGVELESVRFRARRSEVGRHALVSSDSVAQRALERA